MFWPFFSISTPSAVLSQYYFNFLQRNRRIILSVVIMQDQQLDPLLVDDEEIVEELTKIMLSTDQGTDL